MANNGRFTELDGLRGIAACSVLALHYTSTSHTIIRSAPHFPWPFVYGGLGVQLFFIISGFVILMSTKRHSTARDFLEARAVRLYPTYWACLALTTLVIFGTGFRLLYRPAWEIVINATMLQSFVAVRDFDGVYWSLAREIVFYLIIAVALAVFHQVPRWFAVWMPVAWSAVGLGLILLHDSAPSSKLLTIVASASVAQYAPLFGIGMALYLYRSEGRLPASWLPLLVFAGLNEALMTTWTSGILVLLIGLAVSGIVWRGHVGVLRLGVLTWLGAISYPLYLIHQNVGYWVISHTTALGGVGSRVAAVACALTLAWAIHEVVEVRLCRAINRALRNRSASRQATA